MIIDTQNKLKIVALCSSGNVKIVVIAKRIIQDVMRVGDVCVAANTCTGVNHTIANRKGRDNESKTRKIELDRFRRPRFC